MVDIISIIYIISYICFVSVLNLRKLFYDERNFWISLLGFLVWTACWRLEVLYRRREESVEPLKVSRASRLSWMALGCVVVILADLPLCAELEGMEITANRYIYNIPLYAI